MLDDVTPPTPETLIDAFDHLIGEVHKISVLIQITTPDHRAFEAATELAGTLREAGQQIRREVATRIRDTHRLSLAQLADVIGVSRSRAAQMVGPSPRKEPAVPTDTSPLPTRVEVWPVAADSSGLWLVSKTHDAWRSGTIRVGDTAHDTALELIGGNALRLIHSTGWRPNGGDSLTLIYVAALDLGDAELVQDVWPHALPLDPAGLFAQAGKPSPHPPVGVPVRRYLDVLLHVIRHLSLLVEQDAAVREALGGEWRRQLAGVAPALAGMYEGE